MSTFDTALLAVLSTALDAAIVMREDGSIAEWNDVAEHIFGWTFAEVDGRQLSEVIIPPEMRSRHDDGLKRYLGTGVAKNLGKHIEVTAIDRSGRRFPAELSSRKLEHEGEQIFVGFVRDISVRKEAEKELEEMSERLELAVRTHCIGVFDTNPQTREVYWNEELHRIFGYVPGQFESKLSAWRRHVFSKDLARIDTEFKQAINDRAAEVKYSYRMTRCDGELRHIEASARLFYDAGGNHVRRVGVNIDVTERIEVERKLIKTQEELTHLSRLNSLGAVASTLSHELNQPLAAITNHISAALILLQQFERAELKPAQGALEHAVAMTLRAGKLIKRLRFMASKGLFNPTVLSLTTLMRETAPFVLDETKSEGISLQLAIEPAADNVYADRILLQQAVFNLFLNAVQALADSGGTITVRASIAPANKVMIEIEDTGPGLDHEIIPNIFTAFVSTKIDGMGVGLSICRTIIEKNGGSIWFESSGTGTRFFFTLPRNATSRKGHNSDR